MEILERAQKMIDRPGVSPSELCRIYLKRIEHIYFKFDPLVIKQKNVSTRPINLKKGVHINDNHFLKSMPENNPRLDQNVGTNLNHYLTYN